MGVAQIYRSLGNRIIKKFNYENHFRRRIWTKDTPSNW
jgi:hypothetical protein